MIFLVALALIVAAFGGYYRFRSQGSLPLLLDVVAAAVSGWIAGLLLGVGARIGMWAIPFFNGTEPRFSFDGSLRVVLTFSLFGIGLGILYEVVFRKLFRNHGILFGLAISILTVYPLGREGVELLNFSPSILSLAFFTFFFIAIIFVPFAVALEFFVCRWHRFHDASHESLAALAE
jgi:hypothetical protein